MPSILAHRITISHPDMSQVQAFVDNLRGLAIADRDLSLPDLEPVGPPRIIEVPLSLVSLATGERLCWNNLSPLMDNMGVGPELAVNNMENAAVRYLETPIVRFPTTSSAVFMDSNAFGDYGIPVHIADTSGQNSLKTYRLAKMSPGAELDTVIPDWRFEAGPINSAYLYFRTVRELISPKMWHALRFMAQMHDMRNPANVEVVAMTGPSNDGVIFSTQLDEPKDCKLTDHMDSRELYI